MTLETSIPTTETIKKLDRIIDAHTQPGMWQGPEALKAEINKALKPPKSTKSSPKNSSA